MWRIYQNFIRGVSVNTWGKAGIILTTSTFITFLVLEVARLAEILTNQYMGLITYMVLPLLFVIGLVLIPVAWNLYRKTTGKTTRELLRQQFPDEEIQGRLTGSRLFLIVLGLTLVNVLFMVGVSMRTLHFMDQPRFCGNACHQVMNPEWTTYQVSPHARVKCVECHVGEGIDALIDSKLNGLYQIISATFHLYEQPIPTPVHQLRPAQETCEHCHWPAKFYGNKLLPNVSYALDSLSTPRYTTLNLKIDSGLRTGSPGIHWHIADENQVRYASVGDDRRRIIWVEVRQPDGMYIRYENTRLSQSKVQTGPDEEARIMDCVDCHNRATHIYEQPERAVDERIRLGAIPRSLPFVKREALSALTNNYNSVSAAMQGITNHMQGFYRRNFPRSFTGSMSEIDTTITVLHSIWRRNIHPEMDITWGTYPSHIGHPNEETGCFRCHNKFLQTAAGQTINDDCTLCHSLLANQSAEPFEYLQLPDEEQPEFGLRQYLREEFLDFFVE